MSTAARRVGCELVVDVDVDPVRMTLQLAAANRADLLGESLTITSGGRPVPHEWIEVPGVGMVHVCHPPPGRMHISYQATVGAPSSLPLVTPADEITYRRPSRYAESDRLAPMAQAEFEGITDYAELLAAVSSWVGSRLIYVPGSSGPTDGAVDTMLKRQGVCRDYAHLVIALLRALDVPARLAAVYAPGLYPMDFHAVAEAAVDGVWRVVDATLLAPRSSLIRIASGRDSADSAVLSTYGGGALLLESEVTATIDGMLPVDDVIDLVSI